MIELDVTSDNYVKSFEHLKNPPTHAEIILVRYCLHEGPIEHKDIGFRNMTRKHVEAVYVYGRTDESGNFVQSPSDVKIPPIHAGLDMTDYDVSDNPRDSESRKAFKETCKRTLAIRDSLVAEGERPHPDDPTKRVAAPEKRKNKFSEGDMDVVFSHTDYYLRGKAV